MNYYFITGTSRGIGRALAEKLLKDSNTKVIGISRKSTIIHPRYEHVFIDLTMVCELEKVLETTFKRLILPQKIVLINNSGMIGEVKHIGKTNAKNIISSYNLNVIAPSILTNSFMKAYRNSNCDRIIINVSSGAGKNPIDGWATYCSSKSALDMFSRVVVEEQKLSDSPFRIYAIAPGVVDTEMQVQIRKSNSDDFSMIQKFIDYKNENQLKSPEEVASKYMYFLENEKDFSDTILSVRNF